MKIRRHACEVINHHKREKIEKNTTRKKQTIGKHEKTHRSVIHKQRYIFCVNKHLDTSICTYILFKEIISMLTCKISS